MADPMITVEPPQRLPRKGGLLSIAEVRPASRLASANGVQYVPDPCELRYDAAGFCYVETPVTADKNFTSILNSTGVIPNFGLHYGVSCWINDEDDFAERARAGLDFSESRGLESILWAWINGATALTAATGIVAAIAALEQSADDLYIGQPIIHINRGDAVRAAAAGALSPNPVDDGKLWTANGTPVVASAKYPAGTLGITGGITVFRSDIVDTRTEALEDNTAYALAERVYGIAVDCDFRRKVTFTG